MHFRVHICKNGTNGTRDCRWFAVIYPSARILWFIIFTLTLSSFCVLTIISLIVVVVLITVVQPFIISCSTLAICPATAKLYLKFPMRLLCVHGKPWWFCSTLILCVY